MPPAHTRHWSAKMPLYLFVAFALCLSVIFCDTIFSIIQSWQKDEYSHGYLIPFLSLLLFLNKMSEKRPMPRAAGWGAVVVIGGVVAQFAFQFSGIKGVLPQIYLISLIGLIALFWGTETIRLTIGSLVLLFFCTPLPKLLFYTLSFNLQMLSSSLGAAILHFVGIPVFQDGNIIDLGTYRLEVAEACNGIRYLFPLLGLSFLLAYLFRTFLWKRALIFISAVPIAILMNALRIAFIGMSVDAWGSDMAKGLLHDFAGWVVFTLCVALLIAKVCFLQKIGRHDDIRFDDLRLPNLKTIPCPVVGKPTFLCGVFLVMALAGNLVVGASLQDYLKPIPLQQSFSHFPLQIGEWAGRPQTLDAASLDILGTTDYLIADYAKRDTPPVNLYALYYPKQDSSSNQAIHSPAVCVPAGGWTIERKTGADIALRQGYSVPMNRMVISKGPAHEIVYYWFVQDGMPVRDPNLSKFIQIKNAVLAGRSDGAMIRLVTEIGRDETENDADQRIFGFMNEVLPELNAFLFPLVNQPRQVGND